MELFIYLAGKVSHTCWRHRVVEGLRGVGEPFPDVMEGAIHGHHYTGPFFEGDDHGSYHGKTQHGVLPAGIPTAGLSGERLKVARRALRGIDTCNLFFAWIDARDCYGTLFEIGYAAAIGKRVYIGVAEGFDAREFWFSLTLATNVIRTQRPEDALAFAIESVTAPVQ